MYGHCHWSSVRSLTCWSGQPFLMRWNHKKRYVCPFVRMCLQTSTMNCVYKVAFSDTECSKCSRNVRVIYRMWWWPSYLHQPKTKQSFALLKKTSMLTNNVRILAQYMHVVYKNVTWPVSVYWQILNEFCIWFICRYLDVKHFTLKKWEWGTSTIWPRPTLASYEETWSELCHIMPGSSGSSVVRSTLRWQLSQL